jgi:hypothetical protein
VVLQEAFVVQDKEGDTHLTEANALQYYNSDMYPACKALLSLRTTTKGGCFNARSASQVKWLINIMTYVRNLLTKHQRSNYSSLSKHLPTLPSFLGRNVKYVAPSPESFSEKEFDFRISDNLETLSAAVKRFNVWESVYRDLRLGVSDEESRHSSLFYPSRPPTKTAFQPKKEEDSLQIESSPRANIHKRLYNVLQYLLGKVNVTDPVTNTGRATSVVSMPANCLLTAEEKQSDVISICKMYYILNGGVSQWEDHLCSSDRSSAALASNVPPVPRDKFGALLHEYVVSMPRHLKERCLMEMYDMMR